MGLPYSRGSDLKAGQVRVLLSASWIRLGNEQDFLSPLQTGRGDTPQPSRCGDPCTPSVCWHFQALSLNHFRSVFVMLLLVMMLLYVSQEEAGSSHGFHTSLKMTSSRYRYQEAVTGDVSVIPPALNFLRPQDKSESSGFYSKVYHHPPPSLHFSLNLSPLFRNSILQKKMQQ